MSQHTLPSCQYKAQTVQQLYIALSLEHIQRTTLSSCHPRPQAAQQLYSAARGKVIVHTSATTSGGCDLWYAVLQAATEHHGKSSLHTDAGIKAHPAQATTNSLTIFFRARDRTLISSLLANIHHHAIIMLLHLQHDKAMAFSCKMTQLGVNQAKPNMTRSARIAAAGTTGKSAYGNRVGGPIGWVDFSAFYNIRNGHG